MSFSVAGKTAIVTGAANGVGLAIARHLADAGANVMFADKTKHACVRRSVMMTPVIFGISREICVRN